MKSFKQYLINEASKKAAKDYDGDGKVESGTEEYLGSRSNAIKAAMAKGKKKKKKKKK